MIQVSEKPNSRKGIKTTKAAQSGSVCYEFSMRKNILKLIVNRAGPSRIYSLAGPPESNADVCMCFRTSQPLRTYPAFLDRLC
jgi:hypothetical protein